MDPLSDVLALVRPRSYVAGGLTAGGRWAVRFPAHAGIKCYVITQGACWLVLDAPVRLATGDCVMLPHGREFRLCSDLDATPVDLTTMYAGGSYSGIRACAPGDDFFLLGGHFVLDGNADLLRGVLPSVVHLPDAGETFGSAVERMLAELRDPQPGSVLIAQQCAYTMLVLALRLCRASGAAGWLHALADPAIARAIATMHDRLAESWTVEALAEIAAMSRTTFAERFRATMGTSPIEYLTQWRMLVAGDRLQHSNDSLAEIARLVGYESESAFGAAFKRAMGTSPGAYRRARR
ncbi:AraC family transcriptional regulator [Nannocystis exedens]|uniref:AraC family transcriptional regulator n=1 Tax=Nannocystis exedens TaxID=54 RepID=UPI000BBA0C29|nr:AraC family transcriptional regulator [Nannocystis exedens]PCC74947.1 AraC family transcriptional regulator [Nannocystis exedens]